VEAGDPPVRPSTIWPQLGQYLSVTRTSFPHRVQYGKLKDTRLLPFIALSALGRIRA